MPHKIFEIVYLYSKIDWEPIMKFLILQEYLMAELFSQLIYIHMIAIVSLILTFLLQNVAIQVRVWDMRLQLL